MNATRQPVSCEEMAEEIRLASLAQHIQDALRREDLPPLHASKFREHLGRVQAALKRLRASYAGE